MLGEVCEAQVIFDQRVKEFNVDAFSSAGSSHDLFLFLDSYKLIVLKIVLGLGRDMTSLKHFKNDFLL